MIKQTLIIDPITPKIGAEIHGVDLSKPLPESTIEAIYQILVDYLVIFFRDQDISPQAHLDFAQAFGELDQPHPIYPNVPSYEQIVLLENDADNPPDTDDWHTDLTFRQNPPFASILFAHTVPPSGGDTLWANMYEAYSTLPDYIKAGLADLEAVHDMGAFRNDYIAQGGVEALNAAMTKLGSAVHPVVKYHPITQRPYLYVNRSFTVHVLNMLVPESNRLLTYLLDHINNPSFQVRFRWRANSLAMWDNRVTQHYAVADYLPHRRRMHRITVLNDFRSG